MSDAPGPLCVQCQRRVAEEGELRCFRCDVFSVRAYHAVLVVLVLVAGIARGLHG